MIQFLNPDKTGYITVSSELPLKSSLSESRRTCMDPDYWEADDGSRVMHLGVNRPCSHVGLKKRNNNGILL